jgi:hypothetical protein
MARREDLWSQLYGINPEAENLFADYSDPYNYDQMSAILDKILGEQSNMITRKAGNAVSRGQKDVASRLAAEGITGGSVYNNQINKVASDINENFANSLEGLGISRLQQEVPLMNMANESKFRNTTANQNMIMQNIMNKFRKNQMQQGFLSDWEQSDRMNDAAKFDFFRDLLPGLVSGGASVLSAGVTKGGFLNKKD